MVTALRPMMVVSQKSVKLIKSNNPSSLSELRVAGGAVRVRHSRCSVHTYIRRIITRAGQSTVPGIPRCETLRGKRDTCAVQTALWEAGSGQVYSDSTWYDIVPVAHIVTRRCNDTISYVYLYCSTEYTQWIQYRYYRCCSMHISQC